MGLGDLISGVLGTGQGYTAQTGSFAYDGDDPANAGARRREAQLQALGDKYGSMGAPQIDYGNAGQDRGASMANDARQGGNLDALQQAAAGHGPSAAQAQFQQSLDQSIAAQQAMAASARGPGASLAGFNGAVQAGKMQQQGVAQAGALRAQEQQAAQQQYTSALGQQRAQDLQMQGLDAQQAQAQAAMEMQQRGLGLQGELGAQGLSNQVGLAQMQARQNYEAARTGQSQFNAGQNQQGFQTVAGLAAGAAAAASDERLKTDIAPITGDAKADAGDDWKKRLSSFGPAGGNKDFAQAYQTGGNFGSALSGLFGGGADAGAAEGAAPPSAAGMAMVSDERAKEQVRSLALDPPGADYPRERPGGQTADLGSLFALAVRPRPEWMTPVGREAAAPSSAQSSQLGDPNAARAARATAGSIETNMRGTDAGYTDAWFRETNGLQMPAVKSDERKKFGLSDAANPISHMLENLRPVSYEYKVPQRDGAGRQYGVIAQDLERSPMGDSMVMDTPQGKMVDTRKAAMGSLAALSEHHDRLTALEDAVGLRAGAVTKKGKR